MSLRMTKEHNGNCINCGTKITTYENTRSSGGAGSAEVAFCDSCGGYPCYCHRCGWGAFIVYENPLSVSIECPRETCRTHVAVVQIKDGWW